MTTLQITVLDPDTTQAQIATRHLRTILKCEGLPASVQEVTCYLEISRRGLTEKTPVISVNEQNFQCKNLSTTLLDQFVQWLSQKLND